MSDIIEILMAIIKSEISQAPLKLNRDLTDDDLVTLYDISVNHDLAHIVGRGLSKNSLLKKNEIGAKFKKAVHEATFRYLKLNKAQNEIYSAFEKAKIHFIPLKGAVIREFYPEPWMRTSCDIDILVKDEDVEHACQVLINECSYHVDDTFLCDLSYDVSFLSQNNDVHIELHHSLTSLNAENKSLVNSIWNLSRPSEKSPFMLIMPDEYFYFHQIMHLSKHFKSGGSGIRSFMDIWILNHFIEFDKQKRDKLLDEHKLLKFASACQSLSEIWFGNGTYDELTKQVEKFILSSGTYGNTNNSVITSQTRKENKLKYIFSRIWMPYRALIVKYPSLKKRPYLFPFYEIYRCVEVLFNGRLNHIKSEVKIVSASSEAVIQERADMLMQLGLN